MAAGPVTFDIEFDVEEDGRIIASVEALPGVMVYGATKEEATKKVVQLARAVLIEHILDQLADTQKRSAEEMAEKLADSLLGDTPRALAG